MRAVNPAARQLALAGCTQSQLAEALGVSQRAVSYYLAGERPLPVGFRRQLEDITSRGKARRVVEAIPGR